MPKRPVAPTATPPTMAAKKPKREPRGSGSSSQSSDEEGQQQPKIPDKGAVSSENIIASKRSRRTSAAKPIYNESVMEMAFQSSEASGHNTVRFRIWVSSNGSVV